MPSGFYRIVEAASGAPLRVLCSAAGATDPAALRSVAAKVGVQDDLPNISNPAALGDDKTPGGTSHIRAVGSFFSKLRKYSQACDCDANSFLPDSRPFSL